MSHYGRPEYSDVRCLLFGANLTDVGVLRYVCLLFPDGKNILAGGTLLQRHMRPVCEAESVGCDAHGILPSIGV